MPFGAGLGWREAQPGAARKSPQLVKVGGRYTFDGLWGYSPTRQNCEF